MGFTHHPNSLHDAPSTSLDMETVSKMGPTIAKGLQMLRVLMRNLPVDSEPPRATRARDEATQGVASSWHFSRTHRGDPTPSSFISESRPGGLLHASPCGLAPSRPGFPTRDYPRKTLETTWLGFDQGWGH
jgi:hypothetical protein